MWAPQEHGCAPDSPPDPSRPAATPTCSTATSVCAILFRRKGGRAGATALQSRVTQVSSAVLICGDEMT